MAERQREIDQPFVLVKIKGQRPAKLKLIISQKLRQRKGHRYIYEYVKSEILYKNDAEIQNAIKSFLRFFATDENKAKAIAQEHGIHIGEAHVKILGESLEASLFLSNERKVL